MNLHSLSVLGFRFCDVKDHAYKHETNHLMKFEWNKAKEYTANSGVIISLNDGLLSLIEVLSPTSSISPCTKVVTNQ